jgi:hypothetical protein
MDVFVAQSKVHLLWMKHKSRLLFHMAIATSLRLYSTALQLVQLYLEAKVI